MSCAKATHCACRRYCNAARAGGYSGPLCTYCAHVDSLVQFWSRVFK